MEQVDIYGQLPPVLSWFTLQIIPSGVVLEENIKAHLTGITLPVREQAPVRRMEHTPFVRRATPSAPVVPIWVPDAINSLELSGKIEAAVRWQAQLDRQATPPHIYFRADEGRLELLA